MGRGITLDAGALIAFERGDSGVRSRLRSLESGAQAATIPTVAIAETWRDRRRQVLLARLLGASRVEQLDRQLAQHAGELLGRTGTSDAIDAIVACSAARRGDIVLTTDPGHLQRLADDLRTIKVIGI